MKLLIVLPCYNEEMVLRDSIFSLFTYFEDMVAQADISAESRICFVDDGSDDLTWKRIEEFTQPYVRGIKLSKNFGHQKALLAGLESFANEFDSYATLDVDLQDDHRVLKEMILCQKKGFDIVYGVRNDRTTDNFFKRGTARAFYKLMEHLGVKSIKNHADYRMINNKTLSSFLQFKEYHLFLRAIFPLMGFRTTIVYYKRQARGSGNSKYSLRKMIAFAWEGITSFSTTPLRLVLAAGLFSLLISFVLMIWATIELLIGNTITGWFSIITLIMFFGGIQTFAIGILGEYIGKIFVQVKSRPRYIIEKIIKN